MKRWSPQHYKLQGKKDNINDDIINSALEHARRILSKNSNLTPIFTLRHLSYLANVEYSYLRSIVYRDSYEIPYRYFHIKKRSSGTRRVYIPQPQLNKVQKYIHNNILKSIPTHESSFAYTTGISIYDAAQTHTNSKWLIKLDITNFFESISEISVYKIFQSLNFPTLLSFELARICTWNNPRNPYLNNIKFKELKEKPYTIYATSKHIDLGYLPQGAPTSPALSNLACIKLDTELLNFANIHTLEYSRYSDDITFSSKNNNFSRKHAIELIKKIYTILIKNGFKPNKNKTKIISPRSKKIVLGLNVDRKNVKLDKKFKNKILQHIHFCLNENIGPVQHAKYKKFSSVLGFRNHLYGLIMYAYSIDKEFGEKVLKNFNKIDWPIS